PKGAQYYSDFDLVYTNHSDSVDFSRRKTYARPDSIIKITGDVFNGSGGTDEPTFLPSAYTEVIVKQVDENMAAYGWTKVDKNANPDVVLLMSASNTSYMYWYYDWGYWGWYYPGYYPGWGWYYPGYYPPYVSTYTTGTLLIQMTDQQQVVNPTSGTTANVPVIWVCVLNGLVDGSTADVAARVQTNLNQAFVQSPYLKH
ncbi:MAG TPA: DUF4136 domain-containing protein, partial [Puia sp.]|nr:DUF4136 domain-containing protein [Puia sp.]